MKSTITILMLSCLFSCSVWGDLPPEIEKCAAGDTICIAKVMTHVLHTYPKGIPEIGLGAVDAIDFSDVVISKAEPNSPIQLNLKFNKMTLRGFENCTVLEANGFSKDLSELFVVTSVMPLLRLDGEYETSGKVLLLPLVGKGQARVELKDCKITCKTKAAEGPRVGGKMFAKILKSKCVVDIKGMHVNFQNLFNNKDLSDSMNTLVNENWQDIWQNMRSGVNLAVGHATETLLKSVAQKLSYDDFYKAD